MATKALLKEPLLMLDICGLNPINQNVWSIFRASFSMVLCLNLCAEILTEIIYNWDGLHSMEDVAILAAVYQLIVKLFMMLVNSNKLVKLLNNMDEFPDLSMHGESLQHKFEDIYSTATKYMKAMCYVFSASLINYFLIPIFLKSRALPFPTYHPRDRNKSPYYQIAYFLQMLFMSYECIGLLGFDFFFVLSILHLIFQLQLVKERFRNIKINMYIEGDEDDTLKEVYRLIDHHNLIMKCIKRLEDIYSMLLLSQFLSSLVCICAALLGIIADGFPPTGLTLFKEMAYLGTGVSQLFAYCLAGGYLMSETESIAMGVYESKWWIKTQPKLRNALALVIQRANKTGKLTAGGMYVLNLENFTSVVKTALSFFTLVQAVYTR